jgi:hypothetical protein
VPRRGQHDGNRDLSAPRVIKSFVKASHIFSRIVGDSASARLRQ